MKKKNQNLGKLKLLLLFFCVVSLFGCGKEGKDKKDDFETLMEGAKGLYEKAENHRQIDSVEFQKKVVEYIGEKGYACVDQKAQIDMVHPEQVEKFCEKAKKGEKAEVVLYLVMEQAMVVRYELHTNEKKMEANVSSIRWIKNKPCLVYQHSFKVHAWKYTKKGYFFIEEYHPPGFDGPSGTIGFRVKPLDPKLRELNRKYVLPIGYQLNNTLITSWSQQDFGKLNLYDLYELEYPQIYGQELPYEKKEGAEYQIPKEEFESVLKTRFPIHSDQMQKQAMYQEETKTYCYRPRGLHDCELPYGPYPEVVSYEEMEDGTLKLIVEAVWEIKMLDQAFRSELVVEPLEEETYRYRSNTILSPISDKPRWYMPRLTEEQWNEVYEKGNALPIENKEMDEPEEACISALNDLKDFYAQARKEDTGDVILADSVMEKMKQELGRRGVPVISSQPYSVMENYQEMEAYLQRAQQGKKGNIVLYDILKDGSIERRNYLYNGEEMELQVVRAAWNKEGDPTIVYRSDAQLKEWRYTKKGWFAYELCVPNPPDVSEIIDGSYMIRVKPLNTECIELSKKCVFPLGYRGNNLLCSNWDREHLEELDYNGLYEYLYQMKYQKKFVMEKGKTGIPAESFEQLITEYIPVTVQQLRNIAAFDEEKQEYIWTKLGCGNYAPTYFGTSLPEVIHVEKQQGGILVLTVEAVCDTVISNEAMITHKLTVQCKEDGSFQYLGNTILEDGIHRIPQYQYRIARDGI